MDRCLRCIAAQLEVAGVCGKLRSSTSSRVQPSKACSLYHQAGRGGAALRRRSPCRRWRAGRGSPPAGAGEDPHDVLDVSPGASRDEVRAAYLAAIRAAHPDVNPSLDATRAAAAINAAYEALMQDGALKSSRWGTSAVAVDVFDAPEAEATELFINPFGISGVSPLAWRELQVVARSGGDPAEALWQAGVTVTESGVVSLTPGQLAAVEDDLERMEADPSPVGLEVVAWVLADNLARAQHANARQPTPRRR